MKYNGLTDMKIKGIDYDLGVSYMGGISSHPTFDQAIIQREIEIIKNDLHCNAIRLNGHDLQRLAFAGEQALDQGLQVWLLPKYVDTTAAEALPYLTKCALVAEKLRQRSQSVVFIIGCELTLFLKDILEGANLIERIGSPASWERMWRGDYNGPLNDFLAKAALEGPAMHPSQSALVGKTAFTPGSQSIRIAFASSIVLSGQNTTALVGQ